MYRRALTILTVSIAAGLIAVLGLGIVAAQELPSAERTIDEMTVAAGETVTVTITAANYGLGGTVTETLPDGFSYVRLSSSLDTDDSQVRISGDGKEVTFVLIGRNIEFTYKVTASTTAPLNRFSGELNSIEGSAPVTGEDTVTGEEVATPEPVATEDPATPEPVATEEAATPEPGAATATRSFDTTMVAPEGELTVTITAANYGLGGTVTEMLDEFRYVRLSSSLDTDDSQVMDNGEEVTFVLIGRNIEFTYKVTASTTAGPNRFSGQLDGVEGSAPVTGDDTVTVGAAATRSFNRTTVAPNGGLTVTITAANYGVGGTVTETLPDGFRYVRLSSNLETDDSQVRISDQEVTFVLIGEDVEFTYKVTASRTARSYSFSGQLNGVDGSAPVVGDSSVRVRTTPSTGGGGTGGGGGSGSGSGRDTGDVSTPAPAVPADNPPIIAGGTREEFNVPENMTAVTSLSVVDGRTVTWKISGGFDAAEFSIGADSGELMFKAAPDFENPTDEGANNVYVVVVGATDSDTLSDTLLVLVTVTDVVDESTPTPEPTATAEPTAEPTVAPTAMPTLEPTAAPTATPVATSMPEPTATAMPEPTATSMPEPTATSAPVATATSMPAATATSMPAVTATSMPEATATSMPAPTATSMPAPTAVAPEEGRRRIPDIGGWLDSPGGGGCRCGALYPLTEVA